MAWVAQSSYQNTGHAAGVASAACAPGEPALAAGRAALRAVQLQRGRGCRLQRGHAAQIPRAARARLPARATGGVAFGARAAARPAARAFAGAAAGAGAGAGDAFVEDGGAIGSGLPSSAISASPVTQTGVWSIPGA